MKKFLKITTAILILLLIFFVGTFKYRQHRANQVLIPADAGSVVKINADQLYKTIAFNMLAHPWQYLKPDTLEQQSPKNKTYNTGLKMPSALYFYTLKAESGTSFYTRLKVKDVKQLMRFLQQELHFRVVKNPAQYYFATSPTKNVSVLFGAEEAAMVCAAKPLDEDSKVLQHILEAKNFVPLADSPFKNMMAATDHVVYGNQRNLAVLNFKSGYIEFSEEYEANSIIPAQKPMHRKFNPESSLTLWLDATLKRDPKKQYAVKNFRLEKDSLVKYYNGYFDLEWINSTQQTDSIITYAYNDDFEKVEKVSLQTRSVPDLILSLRADARGLKNYLNQQGVINLANGTLNKTAFPLYKVFLGKDQSNLVLSTQKNPAVHADQIPTQDFFYLNVNFLKLNQQIQMPVLAHYFKPLKQLDIKGRSSGNGKVKLTGKLELKNQDLNSLYQLLKGL